MGEFSLTHILVVLIIFLIFFGPKRLPQLGQSLGEAIRGFKEAMNADPTKDPNQARQSSASTPPADTLNQAPAAHNTKEAQNIKDPSHQS